MEYRCYNGHDVNDGVPLCPVCRATTYPKGDAIEKNPQEETPETALITLEQKEAVLLKWLATIKVSSQDEQKNCEDMLIHARQALKGADAKRKELLEPAKKEQDRINNLFKPFIDKLTIGIDSVNRALKTYHDEQSKIAETTRLKALTEQAEAIAASKVTGEIIELPNEIIPTVAKTSRSNLGSVTYRDAIEVQVVNPDLVPRDLCSPNLTLIRKRAESGVKDIPGVVISKKVITVARGG